ncbi:oxidoreductase [Stachybotrys elegans]|uniref:Oxidoreductase n=1 Tax=Stachybotrys elegans TaxID=80388 RepID=A0A8K0SWA6_9HYPO|nr:oxidoreductase [Stachybotrys elegans]
MDQSFTKTWHKDPYPFLSLSRPELSASGKNVVVTGGGTGIGRAIAVAFAQAGAKTVAIVGRRADKLKEGADVISAAAKSKDTQVVTETADILNLDELTVAFKSISDKVGKLDVLVLNAGGGKVGNILTLDANELKEGFDLNVVGALNSLKAFHPVASAEPIYLYTATGNAHTPAQPMLGAYTLTKGAGVILLDHFQVENPSAHVVNVVPGFIKTDLNGHHPAATDSAELAGAFYVWLASAEAKFLKGKMVWANWDAEEMVKRADEIKSSKLLTTIHGGTPV